MGLISGTRGCMYNCGEKCSGECLKEQKKKGSPQDPAVYTKRDTTTIEDIRKIEQEIREKENR